MNRLIRIVLYITAGCVGIGCAALILGLALGGADELRSDKQLLFVADRIAEKIQNRISDGVAVSDEVRAYHELEQCAAWEGTGEYTYDSEDTADYSSLYEETFTDAATDYGLQQILGISSSEVQNIEISLHHASLMIEDSYDDQIQVAVSDTSDGIYAECDSGKIEVRDERKGSHGREEARVYLFLPEGRKFQNINIEADAGYVEETSFSIQAEHFTVSADAGVIYLEEITADVFTASVGTGEISVIDGIFDTVKLNCGVGVMDVEAEINGNAQIDCGMGSVNVELENGADSVDYALKCGAGTIEIDDNTYSGFSKERHIDNGSSALFTLNCGMGQICIE